MAKADWIYMESFLPVLCPIPHFLSWFSQLQVFLSFIICDHFKQLNQKATVSLYFVTFLPAIAYEIYTFKGFPRGPSPAENPDYKWHLSGFLELVY